MTWLQSTNEKLIQHRYQPISPQLLDRIAERAVVYVKDGYGRDLAFTLALYDFDYGIVVEDVLMYDENGRWIPSRPDLSPPPDLEERRE